jgi:hypothetical protein
MSEILSAVPDRTVLRGVDRDPPRRVPDAYGWHVTCSDVGQAPVEKTLVILLNRISAFSKKIISLKDVDQNLDVRITISISPYDEDISLFFSAETIVGIAKLESSFDIEFFASPEYKHPAGIGN